MGFPISGFSDILIINFSIRSLNKLSFTFPTLLRKMGL